MAKCKAESIGKEVMVGLLKDHPDLKGKSIKLKRISEAVFKIAKAELMIKVQENKVDPALADRLDTLRMSKIEKTAGTIEIDKLKNEKTEGVESKTKAEPKIVTGNIWNMDGYKVVTTNLDGIHGAGLAKQALTRGKITKYKNNSVSNSPSNDVITLAVKGREPNTVPEKYKSYKNNAWAEKVTGKNIDLLKDELSKLITLADSSDKMIYLPEAGLGHGEGDVSVIRPLLLEAAKHPMITLIVKDGTAIADVESTRGTVRTDRTAYVHSPLKTEVPDQSVKANERTLKIGGLSIPYEVVPAGSIPTLASTNAGTGRIRIQEGLTAKKVAEYLLNTEEVEGTSEKVKSKTEETRGAVISTLNLKYRINIMEVLRALQDDNQLLRSFLLLHEYRHVLQVEKSGGKKEFLTAYNEDPVKYELDADLFALKALKSEIDLIKDMTDGDFSLKKAGYTVVGTAKDTSNSVATDSTSSEMTLQGTAIAEVGDQIGDNEGTAQDIEKVARTLSAGFNGYVHIKDTGGKGTPEGDAKDKAMREVSDGFVGEMESSRLNNSSTGTSFKTLSDKYSGQTSGGSVTYHGAANPSVVMLARNGSFSNKPLNDETKEAIKDYFESDNATFVVGDMPGVDTQFIDYLDEIGASYIIYTTNTPGKEFDRKGIDGSKYRIKGSSKQKDDTMSSNIVNRTTNNITKEAQECANVM